MRSVFSICRWFSCPWLPKSCWQDSRVNMHISAFLLHPHWGKLKWRKHRSSKITLNIFSRTFLSIPKPSLGQSLKENENKDCTTIQRCAAGKRVSLSSPQRCTAFLCTRDAGEGLDNFWLIFSSVQEKGQGRDVDVAGVLDKHFPMFLCSEE